MKSKVLFTLLVGIFFACKSEKEEPRVFQIKGDLKTYQTEKVVLQSDSTKTLLTAAVKRNSFFINSLDSLPVGLYFLKIGNESSHIPIFIDNTDITVELNEEDISKSYTQGSSKLQRLYYKYRIGSYTTDNLFSFQKGFIEEHNNSVLGAIALKDMLGDTHWRLKQTLALYEQLDSLIQKGKLGKDIITYINTGLDNIAGTVKESIIDPEEAANSNPDLKTTEASISKVKIKKVEPETTSKIHITEYAPFFYGNDLKGSELSAKNVFANNKLTLIDFWASWCKPCRAQNPDLVILYEKYHSKGFEILSVAEDKEDSNWKNAITQDNMIWQHVNDDYKRIANMYGVRTIPHAILVNKQGGILATKISPSQLKNFLRKEFGY